MSPDTYEDLKWYLKKYTYATIFGMNEDNLVSGNVKKLARLQKLGVKTAAKKVSGLDSDLAPYGIVNAGEKFTTFPLIADLLTARNRMLQTIKSSLGMPNAYGELIIVKAGQDERDVLAQVAQSYEMYLLDPVLDYVKQNSGYMSISLASHDGFSIKFHKTEYKEKFIETIINGVNDWCAKHHVNTWLEYEDIPVLEKQPTHVQADLIDSFLDSVDYSRTLE